VTTSSDELVVAQTLPVCLRDVAALRRVKQVVFCPMLQEGLTALEKDGFTIYIRCDASMVHDWNRRWRDPSDGGRTLPTRTRFSVAHEIGHTLFFDIGQERIKVLRGASGPKVKASLESLCNLAASRILLPEGILLAAAGNGGTECRLLDPAELVRLRRQAAISPRALVLRIAQSSIWGNLHALISCVLGDAGQAVIEEAIMSTWLRGFFPRAQHGQPAAHLTDDPALIFNGGPENKAVVDIAEPSGPRSKVFYQPFAFACERIYAQASGYFVTAQCHGARRRSEKQVGAL
jgi:hypothetical protein